jgi:hypothetical protein
VTTQIKLPLYHRPRSPLGLVVVEIIFGRLFEAFRHASYGVGAGAGAGTLVGGTAQPMKKTREVPLKSVLVPRKLIIFYLLLYTNSRSGDITSCRNPFKDGSSKSACQPPLTTPSVYQYPLLPFLLLRGERPWQSDPLLRPRISSGVLLSIWRA